MPTTATRSNKFAATCVRCQTTVPAGVGILTRSPEGWLVEHATCEPISDLEAERRATELLAAAPVARRTSARRSTTARRPSHVCQSCGRRGAHIAFDLSGIDGWACNTCDDGSLSFC